MSKKRFVMERILTTGRWLSAMVAFSIPAYLSLV
jgi:hypothetical protein